MGDVEMDPGILDGTIDDVARVATKIIRVFLSSTFSDMVEERNILLQDVYPKIQEYCKRKYGVTFQMVDMRWGVTNEVQNDHMTSTCCLKEIRNCQNVSIGPNFVVLMGQKYGYRPIPAFVEAEEFEAIRSHVVEEDLELLDLWYVRDDNSVPPQYVLQPINTILRNYDSSNEELKRESRQRWQETFDELRDILMAGADAALEKGDIGRQGREKYFSSVTQEEIEIGLLQTPKDPNMTCLCFVREIEHLQENIRHHRTSKFLDLQPTEKGEPVELDLDAYERLTILRDQEIPKRLNKENIVKLKTTWSEHGGINATDSRDYLLQLCEAFYNKMVWLIDKNLHDKYVEEDEYSRELLEVLRFRNRLSRDFLGRTELLYVVEKYVTGLAKGVPMVVYGESGTGKTALIAKCAKEAKHWLSGANPVIIVRFLGTSPQSSHIMLLLRSLCLQICDVYQFSKASIPTEFKDLVDYFKVLLGMVSSQPRPLVLMLDSVDQLSSMGEPYTFHWLPKVIPPNVKVVISLVPSVFNLLARYKAYVGKGTLIAEPIPPLGDVLCMDIIRARLDDDNRTISPEQSKVMQIVFSKCSIPLYTRVMLDEILTWKSYTAITTAMVSSTLKEALNNFFRRLEMQHGRVLVRHTLSYLTASREGVSEMELLDLLSLDDEVLNSIFLFWLPPQRRLPPFLLTRLYIDLMQFVVARDAGTTSVFTWYHRMFKEAAFERYLSDEESKTKIHSNLADYFIGKWHGKKKAFQFSSFLKSRLALTTSDGEEDRYVPDQPLVYIHGKSSTQFNKRKLSELPYHLVKSRRFEELGEMCVFSYDWLWSKISAFGLQLLVEDLEFALSEIDDSDVQTVADTLRIAGSTLNDHPDNLALEITGRLLDLMDTMPRIKKLIKDCDAKSAAHSSLVVPFQLYEVPISYLISSIENLPADIGDSLLLKKDSRLVAMCLDGTVLNIDTQKGVAVNEISLNKMKSITWQNMGLSVDRHERYIVCECRPTTKYIYILDAETLEIKHEHKMSSLTLLHKIYVSGKYLCMDNAVFELVSGKKVRDLIKYDKKIDSFVELAITMDEKFILIGDVSSVGVFNIETGKRVKDLSLTSTPSVIQLTKDGRLAIVGTTEDCHIKVFDINHTSKTFGLEVVTYDPQKSFSDMIMAEDNYATKEVSEICLAHKEGSFVSLVKRKYPIVWSLKNVSTKPRLLSIPKGAGPFRYLFQVQFSSDDRFILAAELSPNVMMWDSITGALLASFAAHDNDIHSLVVGSKTNLATTVQQNGSVIKVWDLHKVMDMETMSSVKSQELSVKNISLLKERNVMFMTRVHPPKSSRAYHFIDYFGIEMFNFATGKRNVVLPFDKYGHVQTLSNSKSGVTMIVNTSSAQSSTISVINMKADNVHTIKTDECKEIRMSDDGKYVCLLLKGNPPKAVLYTLPEMKEITTYRDCKLGMFTKQGSFVGVTKTRLVVRESMNEHDDLSIDLPGEITAIVYADAINVLLVSVNDGFSLTVTAFKTDGFGAFGTLTDVSRKGISDVANDGSICIDADLKIFELERCKQVKRLLPNRPKSDVSSIRLSRNGEHAVFIDTAPSTCIKVCRISDNQITSQTFLHCVPEVIEVIPSLNIFVVIEKDNKKLFLLSLCDGVARDVNYDSREARIRSVLGVKHGEENFLYELSEKTKEALKDIAASQQVKHMTLTQRQASMLQTSVRRTVSGRKIKKNHSASCQII